MDQAPVRFRGRVNNYLPMKVYLNYNQQARLFSWLQRNKQDCRRLTGKNPLMAISKLLAPMDLGGLTLAHADFSDDEQWWIDRYCPYPFARSEKQHRNIILGVKDWYLRKVKKVNTTNRRRE